MKSGEQVLVWRVYAVCSGIAGLIGIFVAATKVGISFDRITLLVLGIMCVINAIRIARFKRTEDDAGRKP